MDNNENFDKNNCEKDNVSDNAENKYSHDDKILFEVSKGIETVDDTDDFNENISQNNINKTIKKNKKKKKSHSLAGGLVLVTVILAFSAVLALSIIASAQDILGINGSSEEIKIKIEEGQSTSEIAKVLKEKGIIINSQLSLHIVRRNNFV